MNAKQLQQRMFALEEEKASLQSNGGSGVVKRLAEINAELSMIQKALIAVLGVGAVSALTDDGYNDEIPPVITLNGDACHSRAWRHLYRCWSNSF